MVNNSAMRVIGLTLGRNFSSYHFKPLRRTRKKRVNMPPKKGMPR